MQVQTAGSIFPRTGWSSFVSKVAAGILLFELLSGLAITFGPFHPAIEWGILLHTVIGVVTVAPLVWYSIAHWKDYRDQALSDVLLLGYVGVAALAICLVSGAVVTAQALLAGSTSPWLRYAHLSSTLLALATTTPHIIIAWWRRRKSEASEGVAGWLRAGMFSTIAGIVVVGVLSLAYSGTKYHNQFPPDYNYAFGANRPFAPSLAHTSTNGAFDARSLAGSETCGASGCHTQIYNEWKTSAHRYAAMDPIFQGIQNVMAKQNGPESTRYCGGCHDPISLFSGSKNIFVEKLTGSLGYDEGISCLACHSIQKTDIQGNANYTMWQPKEYLWQWSKDHTLGAVTRNFLIRAWPAQHNRLSKRMYKKPEYCAACHKQFIDQEVNRVGWVQLQNQYDNWAASHWNHKGDARTTVECRECHMPLVESTDPAAGDSMDYNRSPDDHKHRSHRFLAANNFVPAFLKLDGADKQVELTKAWLQGHIEIPEIRSKWAEGPTVKIRIEAPPTAIPGNRIPVRVVMTSNKVGHDYPTGPLDMIQSWVELRVEDADGRTIFTSGQRNERNFLPPGTFLFKAEPVDQYGNLIDRHNLWEMVGVRYRRSLFPGYSDTVEYNVMCPSGGPSLPVAAAKPDTNFVVPAGATPGKLRIEAILHYRKIDQFLLNYVMGEKSGLTAPVVDIASATADVCITKAGESAKCP
ncbi:MAG: multiheme c-type cytochrome [Acidobacteriota bacterium]